MDTEYSVLMEPHYIHYTLFGNKIFHGLHNFSQTKKKAKKNRKKKYASVWETRDGIILMSKTYMNF